MQRVTPALADTIVRSGRIGPTPVGDTERRNIATALERIATGSTYPLTVAGICELHRDLTHSAVVDQLLPGEPMIPGRLRTRDTLGGIAARDLPRELQTALDTIRAMPPLEAARAAHWTVSLAIPFADANGRTARLLGISLLAPHHDGDVVTADEALRPHWEMTRDPVRRAAMLVAANH